MLLHVLLWIFTQANVVPIAILTLITLLAFVMRGAWREVGLWLILLCAAMALGAATKVLHYGWNVNYGFALFRGFSGHTLRAAAVFPVFAYALMAGAPRLQLFISMALACFLASLAVIAAVVYQVHTLPESLAGAALGGLAAFALCCRGGLAPLPVNARGLLIVATVALWLWIPTWRPDLEKKLLHFSLDLRSAMHSDTVGSDRIRSQE